MHELVIAALPQDELFLECPEHMHTDLEPVFLKVPHCL